MTEDIGKGPIDPGVFDFLNQYFDVLQDDDVDPDNPAGSPSLLSDFLHTFFRQFFDSGWKMEVTTIDQKAKVQAARIRLRRAHDSPDTARLIASFEELCDRWTDLMELHYGGHFGDVKEFLGSFMAILLARISSWARQEEHHEIRQRADEAIGRLEDLGL